MAHSHHMHREQQVAHRRVAKILSGEPSGSMQHNDSKAFSKVTSKTAAERHDDNVSGHKGAKRYARGGNVKHSDEAEDRPLIKKMINEHDEGKFARGGKVKGKHGHQTNIAIVVPGAKGAAGGPPPGGPPPGAMGPPPGAGGPPGGPPMPPPGAGGPPGMPPGMPMRARGGKIDGESTPGNIKEWAGRASANSYARGGMTAGAESGVGRLQKARRK